MYTDTKQARVILHVLAYNADSQVSRTVFSLKAQSKGGGGGRIENTTTSKGLLHSNDHNKENWAMIEGGASPRPSFGGITNGLMRSTTHADTCTTGAQRAQNGVLVLTTTWVRVKVMLAPGATVGWSTCTNRY